MVWGQTRTNAAGARGVVEDLTPFRGANGSHRNTINSSVI
jgi:hypothetical protein